MHNSSKRYLKFSQAHPVNVSAFPRLVVNLNEAGGLRSLLEVAEDRCFLKQIAVILNHCTFSYTKGNTFLRKVGYENSQVFIFDERGIFRNIGSE